MADPETVAITLAVATTLVKAGALVLVLGTLILVVETAQEVLRETRQRTHRRGLLMTGGNRSPRN